MAAIERGEGASDTVIKGWLARALTVSRGPQWICENCQHIHTNWKPVCENCHSFDTLAWKTPPMSEVAMPGGVQMLPLIVGSTSDNAVTKPEPLAATEDEIEEVELIVDSPEDSDTVTSKQPTA